MNIESCNNHTTLNNANNRLINATKRIKNSLTIITNNNNQHNTDTRSLIHPRAHAIYRLPPAKSIRSLTVAIVHRCHRAQAILVHCPVTRELAIGKMASNMTPITIANVCRLRPAHDTMAMITATS